MPIFLLRMHLGHSAPCLYPLGRLLSPWKLFSCCCSHLSAHPTSHTCSPLLFIRNSFCVRKFYRTMICKWLSYSSPCLCWPRVCEPLPDPECLQPCRKTDDYCSTLGLGSWVSTLVGHGTYFYSCVFSLGFYKCIWPYTLTFQIAGCQDTSEFQPVLYTDDTYRCWPGHYASEASFLIFNPSWNEVNAQTSSLSTSLAARTPCPVTQHEPITTRNTKPLKASPMNKKQPYPPMMRSHL